MIIQRLLLTGGPKDSEGMYCHVVQGGISAVSGKEMILGGNTILSLEAYFNVFSAGKINKYTTIRHVEFKIRVKGSATITAFARFADGRAKTLSAVSSHRDTSIELSMPLDLTEISFLEQEYIFIQIQTGEDSISIFNGGWHTVEQPSQLANMAICICTYHREEYVKKNIEAIHDCFSKDSVLQDHLCILIADNGRTLNQADFNWKNVIVYPNRNYGGSGGFSRCLIEAIRRGEFTHVLMQDDDIYLEPEIIRRTLVFLSYLRDEHSSICIAGGMFSFEEPTIQYEASALWKGRPYANKSELCMDDYHSLLKNNVYEHSDYGAWWYFAMPMSMVSKSNLPLPLFIKCDDVEFGLRNAKKILVMNGIGVWHESFEKKFSPYLEYYASRNALIADTLHPELVSLRKGIVFEFLLYFRWLLHQNYCAADFRYQALADYKKVFSFYEDEDEETLNSRLIECNKAWQSESNYPVENDPVMKGMKVEHCNNKKADFKDAFCVFIEYCIPREFPKKQILLNITNAPLRAYAGYASTIQYNPYMQNAYITHASKKKFWSYFWKYLETAIPVYARSGYYYRQYRKAAEKMTSSEYLCKHLNIQHISK